MIPTSADEARRTSPLALWRYAHEYLCAAAHLCDQLQIKNIESQLPYYAAAQGIEFALKSYLRVRGATMADLHRDMGHALDHALLRCEVLGLPALPGPWRAAVVELAPFHQNHQFVFLTVPENDFPEIAPLIDAGIWILDYIAPEVVDHFVAYLGSDSTPPPPEFVRRLRTALSLTSGSMHPAPGAPPNTARTYSGSWPDGPRAI